MMLHVSVKFQYSNTMRVDCVGYRVPLTHVRMTFYFSMSFYLILLRQSFRKPKNKMPWIGFDIGSMVDTAMGIQSIDGFESIKIDAIYLRGIYMGYLLLFPKKMKPFVAGKAKIRKSWFDAKWIIMRTMIHECIYNIHVRLENLWNGIFAIRNSKMLGLLGRSCSGMR